MKEVKVRSHTKSNGVRVREHLRLIGGYAGLSPQQAAATAAKMLSTGLAPSTRSFFGRSVKLSEVPSERMTATVSHLGAEALAAAAYQTNAENMKLPSGYRMAEKYADPRTGLAVTVFVSPNAKPVVSFRGTEFGSGDVRDLLTDVDPRGIGYGQFNGNKQALAEIAKKYPGATVTGHSLGGALAQRYAAEFGNAGEIITFNSPGIDKGTAVKFKKGSTKVTHYVSHGDAVSLGGEQFIDGTAKIVSYKSGKIPVVGNAYDKHMATITGGLMGLKDAQVQTISSAQLSDPNFKYGGKQATSFTDRRAVENKRKLAGTLASPLSPIVGIAGQALSMLGIGNK